MTTLALREICCVVVGNFSPQIGHIWVSKRDLVGCRRCLVFANKDHWGFEAEGIFTIWPTGIGAALEEVGWATEVYLDGVIPFD